MPNTLIECEIPGRCVTCDQYTRWRILAQDVHCCSPECYQESQEILDFMVHESVSSAP